jgi:hypothetical protein
LKRLYTVLEKPKLSWTAKMMYSIIFQSRFSGSRRSVRTTDVLMRVMAKHHMMMAKYAYVTARRVSSKLISCGQRNISLSRRAQSVMAQA